MFRVAFALAVAHVAQGEDPRVVVRDVGTGRVRDVVAEVLGMVVLRLPAGRREAEHAARSLRWLRSLDPVTLDEGDRRLLGDNAGRDPDDIERWAFEFAVGSILMALFSSEDDGPRGYDATTSEKTREAWSSAAITLGRRLAGICCEPGCETWLGERRVKGPTGRTSRRDYCSTHELSEGDYVRVKREKEVDRLASEVMRAIDGNFAARRLIDERSPRRRRSPRTG